MTQLTRGRFLALLAGAGVAGGLAACTKSQPAASPSAGTPLPADQSVITIADLPATVKLGIIGSIAAPSGQGSDWLSGVGGARVAAGRIGNGTQIQLLARNDAGTRAGADSAVQDLAKQGVSGIVAASAGTHLEGLTESARKAGLAVLLPHSNDESLGGQGVWLTGPTAAELEAALREGLAARHLSRPLILAVDGLGPVGLNPVDTLQVAPDVKSKDVSDRVKPYTDDPARKPDCLVISGEAADQATILAAVQGANLGLPVVLTGQAQAAAFASAVVQAGGTLSVDLLSAGADIGDDVAMRSSADGQAMATFLLANRTDAADARVKALFDTNPYSSIAPYANVLVHDGVVALAQAAAKAKSTDAAAVVKALAGLTLDHTAGIAGGRLDFTGAAALDKTRVVALSGSVQDLGLRPHNPQDPQFQWFRAPGV